MKTISYDLTPEKSLPQAQLSIGPIGGTCPGRLPGPVQTLSTDIKPIAPILPGGAWSQSLELLSTMPTISVTSAHPADGPPVVVRPRGFAGLTGETQNIAKDHRGDLGFRCLKQSEGEVQKNLPGAPLAKHICLHVKTFFYGQLRAPGIPYHHHLHLHLHHHLHHHHHHHHQWALVNGRLSLGMVLDVSGGGTPYSTTGDQCGPLDQNADKSSECERPTRSHKTGWCLVPK